MPCSAPRYFPAAISLSASAACLSASSSVSETTHSSAGSYFFEPRERELRQFGRGDLLRADEFGELVERQEREIGVGIGPDDRLLEPGRRVGAARLRSRGFPRRRVEMNGRRDVVADLDLAQRRDLVLREAHALRHGFAFVVGQRHAGDPLGVLHHLGGDGFSLWLRGRDRRDRALEGRGTDPESGRRGEQLAARNVERHGNALTRKRWRVGSDCTRCAT